MVWRSDAGPQPAASGCSALRQGPCAIRAVEYNGWPCVELTNGRIDVPNWLDSLYTYAWFVTFAISFAVYAVLMGGKHGTPNAE